MAKQVKLPVMQTVVASWRLLIAEWRFSLMLGLLLIVFILLALPAWTALIAAPLSNSGLIGLMPDSDMALFIGDVVMEVPLLFGLAVAMVPLHRQVLLGEARRLPFRFGQREISYGAFLVLLQVVSATPIVLLMSSTVSAMIYIREPGQDGLILGAAGQIAASVAVFGFMILVTMAILYAYARLSLALPGMAIGARAAIANGWRSSRGNGGQLFAVLILVSLPAGLALILLEGILSVHPSDVIEGPIMLEEGALQNREWPAPFAAPSGLMALWATLYTLAVLPAAAALSLCYQRLAGKDEATPPATAET